MRTVVLFQARIAQSSRGRRHRAAAATDCFEAALGYNWSVGIGAAYRL